MRCGASMQEARLFSRREELEDEIPEESFRIAGVSFDNRQVGIA